MTTPLDHVAPGYIRICVPPHGKPQIVCTLFPECMCEADCIDRRDARMVRRILIGFITATIAIAAGLIFWGMR